MSIEESLRQGEHRVKIRGTELWYLVQGNGPLTLLQPGGAGWGGDATPYIGAFKPIESHRKVVYLEPRGIGRSERLGKNANYSIDEYTEDIEALRNLFNIQRIGIIAHSHGAIVALNYAIRYPDRVESLIVIGTPFPSSSGDESNSKWAMRRIGFRKIIRYFLKAPFLSKENRLRSMLKSALPDVHFFDYGTVAEQFNSVIDDMVLSTEAYYSRKKEKPIDFVDQFHKIRSPVLIVRGEVEYPGGVTGAGVLQGSIYDSKLCVIPNSGHWPMLETPRDFFHEVSSFYKGLDSD